jgi:hypothetical protein
MSRSFEPKDTDTYLLHPQAETFGPFDLAFVRDTLARGGIAPTTGLTIIRSGIEDRWHSVGDLWPEPREWTIACAECQIGGTVSITEAITIYGKDDYRREHLKEFVQHRCPKFRRIDTCGAEYPEGHQIGRRGRT